MPRQNGSTECRTHEQVIPALLSVKGSQPERVSARTADAYELL